MLKGGFPLSRIFLNLFIIIIFFFGVHVHTNRRKLNWLRVCK